MLQSRLARARRRFLPLALGLGLAVSGCSDALAVIGLTDLEGYWEGRYDANLDFFLDLDDDVYGVYGRGGFRDGTHVSDFYVDGELDGGRIRIYMDEGYEDGLVFEGRISGADRIDGFVYLELLPEPVTLRRY